MAPHPRLRRSLFLQGRRPGPRRDRPARRARPPDPRHRPHRTDGEAARPPLRPQRRLGRPDRPGPRRIRALGRGPAEHALHRLQHPAQTPAPGTGQEPRHALCGRTRLILRRLLRLRPRLLAGHALRRHGEKDRAAHGPARQGR
ncbi:MAG: hypothetical protein MZV63_65950 [Marinilabiliales bacterium]|nr:hypothetical protein [Marinilabiliales bacterium]